MFLYNDFLFIIIKIQMVERLNFVYLCLLALLLIMDSGVHIGWATYNINESEAWTKKELTYFLLALVHNSYYIGMIFGTLFGLIFIDKVGRRQIQIGALVFYLTNGMLITAFNKYPGIIVYGEIIGGIGSGIIYMTYFVIAGEISCRVTRGQTAAWGALATLIGVWIFAFFTYYTDRKAPLVFVGILTIINSLIATIFLMFNTPESPAFSISCDKDDEARTTFYALRIFLEFDNNTLSTPLTTNEIEMNMLEPEDVKDEFIFKTERLLQDMQSHVRSEQIEYLHNIRNLKIILVITITRIINVILYNIPLNSIILGVLYTNSDIIWIYPFLCFIRLFGCLIGLLTVDIIGRKVVIAISGISGSLLLIGITFIMNALNNSKSSNWPPSFLFLLLQLFSGFGSVMPYIYSTELLPFQIKVKGNALTFIVEIILSIFIMLSWNNFIYVLDNETFIIKLFIYSGISLTGTFSILLLIKETKLISLAECTDKLRKVF